METLITALRAGRPEHTPEAEKVLVTVDGAQVTLTLDDGETLDFDANELLSAATADGRWRPCICTWYDNEYDDGEEAA